MREKVFGKSKGYDFAEVEPRILKFWKKEKIFSHDEKSFGKNTFSIDTPPPTVSGEMHIGHAFSYTQQDLIARYRRMKNGSVFYPFGTDDNGLPTERLVEKLNKVKSRDMSRADFIKLCLKTIKKITPEFIEDWKRIGVSADFENIYSTIDDESRRISQESFIKLYKKGHVYKKKFPTLFCPECQTSIAQAELEDKTRETNLSYFKGKLEDSSFIIYATTRPELHPGCVGISIDESGEYVRAKRENGENWIISLDAVEKLEKEFPMKVIEKFKGKKLVGKKVNIPFAENFVFISHDGSAKTEYGTGVVYYCSYGGLDCVQWLTRHKDVKPILIMDESGKYTKGPFIGMNSIDARSKFLELAGKEGFLVKKEKLIHVVNIHDKCGTDVEYVATKQWFIRLLDKKKELLAQGRKIKWHPNFMHKRYISWIEGLEWDWSISRSRHFGIPIPVWGCESCHEIILAKENELPIDPLQTKKNCPKCKKDAIPERMVLDTWATSSMSPEISSSLVGGKIQLPFSLRPQAHDIIRTWAFYTIVKSYLHENKIPWENIVISGVVSLKGEKMAKSKGNVIDPRKVLEEYGADALRFLASNSKLGGDLDYLEQDLVAGKKIVTKLMNASKFVFMNLEDYKGNAPKKFEKIDKIFLELLQKRINEVTDSFEKYEYSKSKQILESFFWNDFADNYIEIVKKRIYNESGDKKISAQYVLYNSLFSILRMFAPIIPFVTEEIYQTYFRKVEKKKSIHILEWPSITGEIKKGKKVWTHFGRSSVDEGERIWGSFKEILSMVRQAKTNAKKPMNTEINLTLLRGYPSDFISEMEEDLKAVTCAKEIKQGEFNVEFL